MFLMLSNPKFCNFNEIWCQIIEKSPYLLEEIIENITEESSSTVKLHLMTATMKLFFKKPPECVSMLSKLFQYIISTCDLL